MRGFNAEFAQWWRLTAMMTLNKDNVSGVWTITGALDMDAAIAFRQTFLDQSGVELDLSAVDSCDTAGLQVLLAALKQDTLRVMTASLAVAQTAAALGLSLDGPSCAN